MLPSTLLSLLQCLPQGQVVVLRILHSGRLLHLLPHTTEDTRPLLTHSQLDITIVAGTVEEEEVINSIIVVGPPRMAEEGAATREEGTTGEVAEEEEEGGALLNRVGPQLAHLDRRQATPQPTLLHRLLDHTLGV